MELRRRTLLAVFALSAIIFSASTAVGAEKVAVITGKWERGLLEKIYLYRMENGSLKELASAVVADDSTFAFTCKPVGQGDFFYIGKNPRIADDRFAFFLKPGDELDFTVNDSTYTLNGKSNSPENIELTRWHDFVQPLEAKSVYFTKNRSTYVDFFPLLEQKVKVFENYPKSQVKNPTFNRDFETYKNLNWIDIVVGYLFKPRNTHPEGEDFPDYYRNLNVSDFTKTTDLLQYPDAIGFIDKILLCKKSWIDKETVNQAEGFLAEVNTIPDDTVKGEFVLLYAGRQKTHVGLTAFEEKYGKYLITDNQKTRLRNMKNALTVVATNAPAVDFSLQDIKGKEVSLSDYKGKIIYIDFWATWCGPCIKEIPSLQKLDADYHGKDVVFVSISLDKSKDKTKWENFVTSREMKGVQLFAGDKAHKELSTVYKISGIPRFVVIGKDGNIVNPDAPRPSSSEIRVLLDSLLK